ncbi:hypothetical protein X925_10415 [Petrotoga sp. 9T1HF07.CasAA.8.2]|nr:hypothetical protein X925_10415 [Petrotoga sp. 9T1HF07.CasAA.8.2]
MSGLRVKWVKIPLSFWVGSGAKGRYIRAFQGGKLNSRR